jgi:RNA polymerase sigma-70 factor (ECF subfamily)
MQRPAVAEASAETDASAISASLADPDRFTAIYDRYAAMLYRYAYQRMGPGQPSPRGDAPGAAG